jgi:glycogen phosphorylase
MLRLRLEKPPQKYPPLPEIPAPILALRDLALDLRVTWRPEAEALFAALDGEGWRESRRNPVRLLQALPPGVLDLAARDEGYVVSVERVRRALAEEDESPSALPEARELSERGEIVGYFCAEFGIAECLPIYAGGLGILAGDTLKSASDLGVPLVGAGLFYREGYFRQTIGSGGWQVENNPVSDPDTLPLSIALDRDGKPLLVEVEFPGRVVFALVRLARAGRVLVALLDTDVDENSPADRAIAQRLYGGDIETRLQQEILLGIGGLRALDALGRRPNVRHLNEGHAAFATLERARQVVAEEGVPFAEARAVATAGNVFTTHTPVSAGFDVFPRDLVERYFGNFAGALGISFDDLFELGREVANPERNAFSMASLALRLSAKANGVSRLHARVARALWHRMAPEVPVDEVPIVPITNGVHRATWLDPEMRFDDLRRPEPGEIWRRHQALRDRLVRRCREILGRDDALDPKALTIGFARRFATYKRAPLAFTDPDRLARLLGAEGRPVQLIFAGKAHPHDDPGKEFLHRIVAFGEEERFGGRVIFLPDYDVDLARLLVSGCDVWLNNPERPLEASGTSGMKAGMNGVLNLSALDGWWDEAPREETGFSFGLAQDHPPEDVMALALYTALEKDVVPLFYERDAEGVPRGWVEKMRNAIERIGALFSSDRMLKEYVAQCYVPCARRSQKAGDSRNAAPAAPIAAVPDDAELARRQ